jgi:imidazolonepropionase-like amidohydrolase
VLRAATMHAAQAVGLAHEVGTLQVGKHADVLDVDGNPLDDLRQLGSVRRVLRDGEVLVEAGRLVMPRAPDG